MSDRPRHGAGACDRTWAPCPTHTIVGAAPVRADPAIPPTELAELVEKPMLMPPLVTLMLVTS
jgi:hypothetical protein